MTILNEQDFSLMEYLTSLTEKKLKKVMITFLRKKYKDVQVGENYIYAIGEIPIALVSHMDTVFDKPSDGLFYDQRRNVLWGGPNGGGFDDRAGVYAIAKILSSHYRPHIVLTLGEEQGGVGAQELSKIKCPFENIKYMIELDRRGSNDCVFYDCFNDKFIDYVESFGFTEAYGTFSDISFLMEAWKVCGVNLSIGYENEHTYVETLNVGWLRNTIKRVMSMLDDAENSERWELFIIENSLLNWVVDDSVKTCDYCGSQIYNFETFTTNIEGQSVRMCPACAAIHLDYCNNCGKMVCRSELNNGICESCRA